MFDPQKIIKAEVRQQNGKMFIKATEYISFGFTEIEDKRIPSRLMVRQPGLSILSRGTHMNVVLYAKNGDRLAYASQVTMSEEFQISLTIRMATEQLLPERRYTYKATCELPCRVTELTDENGKITDFDLGYDTVATDISSGGLFLAAPRGLEMGEGDNIRIVAPNMLGVKFEAPLQILRVQTDGFEIEGYGCRFTALTPTKNHILSQYILQLQYDERRKRLEEQEQ
ncbi:MAG: PilZ domain-containing protein [Oscillospiraceae bacterium]|nr:PilZ domain-containing protein [Oscillospiraceae bacterium]